FPLSARGREQIDHAKRRLPHIAFSALYAPDLKRAMDSCRIFFDGRTAPPMTSTRALREQHFGLWQGRTWEALRAEAPAQVESFFWDPGEGKPPGGESLGEVRRRVLGWWKSVMQRHRGSLILVVTSQAPIRALICEALELPLARGPRLIAGAATFTVLDAG